MKILKFRTYIVLFLIILIASFLRFWQLNLIPPGVHADEAGVIYTAYNLLKTGLDTHGEFNLLALSDPNIGGNYPPLYMYILIPLVKIFGTGILIGRLPSAIFGVLTVLVIFFLIKKVLKSSSVALITAFLMAINPWAIQISRQGLLEAISVFLVSLGILLFLEAENKKIFYILSGLSLGLSLHSYDSPKIFLPIFIIVLFIYLKKILIRDKKYFLTFLFIFGLFYLLTLKVLFIDGRIERFNRESIVDNSAISLEVDRERTRTQSPLWLSSIFHSKPTVLIKQLESAYFNIFSINWLFINGDGNLQMSVANHGQYYFFELPFFFLGIYQLMKKNKKITFFLLSWFFIGVLPGALTKDGNYPYRDSLLLPIPIIFSAYGISYFWQWIEKYSSAVRYFIKFTLITIIFIYTSSYLFTYFFDYPVYASEAWAKQENDAIKYSISQSSHYNQIFINGGEDWSLIYAYFTKLDPYKYQKAFREQKNFKGVQMFNLNNFYFGNFESKLGEEKIESPSLFFPKNSLVIDRGLDFQTVKPIKSFYDSGGIRAVFQAYSTNENK